MNDKFTMLGQIEYQITELESKLVDLKSVKSKLMIEINAMNAVEIALKNNIKEAPKNL